MADHDVPHFQNDGGFKKIEIGVKKFMCVGASPPFDHPHIFLEMGNEVEKLCPYCSTLYVYNSSLLPSSTYPENCALVENRNVA